MTLSDDDDDSSVNKDSSSMMLDPYSARVVAEDQSAKAASNRHRPWRAYAALNSAALMDGCDDQLLPASFRAFETELHLHPAVLGQITFAQTLALSVSCPVWGYLADRYPRKHIMSFGMISWGLVTLCLAWVNDLPQIICLRALNGAFLGSIGPISQSILADITHEAKRGLQFGLLQMCQSGGRVLGGVVTTSVAMMSFAGFNGWRWTFMAVGFLSLALGVLVQFCVPEFRREEIRTGVFASSDGRRARRSMKAGTGEAEDDDDHEPLSYHHENLNQGVGEFLSNVVRQSFVRPSMLLVLAEGIIGTIPWSAMSFMTMYWQYRGFSDTQAGFVASAVLMGAMIAGPLGGYVGDKVHEASPGHGRAFLGQLSMLGRVPLLCVCFLLSAHSFWNAFAACFGIGLFSFAGVVVNRPLMSDVVRPAHRATVFALVVAIEGACAALLGAPMVGLFAEFLFGYVKTAQHVKDLPHEIRAGNAQALGRAILLLSAIPWCCSFFIYGFIHMTYKRDKERLAEELGLEGEGLTRQTTAPIVGYH